MNAIETQQMSMLDKGLSELNIVLSGTAKEKLIRFLSLMAKWNRAHNLTAIEDPKKMVTHHLLDSLAIQPHIQGHLILDVGTGAGLPGIPLAIANPQKRFVLLDSLKKRITFLQQVIFELQLDNVTLVEARVEDYQSDERFDQIITRAFASLPEMLKLTGHLASDSTRFLAMKGGNYQEELELLLDPYTIVAIHRLNVPGLNADRHLLIVEGSHNG